MAALVTLTIGETHERLAQISYPFFQHYAARHSLEFIPIKTSCIDASPYFQKLVLHDVLSEHERVIYVDDDVLIQHAAPNLLDIVPAEAIGAYDVSKHTTHCDEDNLTIQRELRDIGWGRQNFNTGVMVISRCHRNLFNPNDPDLVKWLAICATKERKKDPYADQTYLNFKAQDLELQLFDIDYQFNHTLAPGNSQLRFRSPFIHCKGHRKGSKEDEMRAAAFVLNHGPLKYLLSKYPFLVKLYDRL